MPTLRSHTAWCALLAALLGWSVPSISLHAQDESAAPATTEPQAPQTPTAPEAPAVAPDTTDTPVESSPVEATRPPTAGPERESRPNADDSNEEVRLHELITIMNSSHLRTGETTPEMVTIMGNATVDGVVNGDCVTVMGNVTVNGKVRGDLICVMGQITLGPGAEVRGETVAVGGAMHVDPTARIRGEKIAITIPGIGSGFGGWVGDWFREGLGKARILPHNLEWAWGTALLFVFLNVLFAAMFRGAVQASASALETRPVLAAVNGTLVFLFFPILLILLAASVVGILLVPVAVAGLFLCWFLGTIGVYLFCGQQFGLREHPVLAVLAGNLVFLLLFALPIIGLAVWSVTGLMGLGGAVTALGNKRREAKEARAAAREEEKFQRQQPPAPPPPTPPLVTPHVQTTPTNPVYMAPPGPTAAPGHQSTASAGFVEPPPAMASSMPGASTTFVPPYSGWTPPACSPQDAASALPPLPADDLVRRATFWARLGAFAIDFFAVAIAANYLNVERVLPFILIAYHIAFWGWRATTPGGIVFNLRIVRTDGSPMNYGVAAVRALGGIFSLLPAGLGFIWASFDSECQAWHDKLAGTNVEWVRRSSPLI